MCVPHDTELFFPVWITHLKQLQLSLGVGESRTCTIAYTYSEQFQVIYFNEFKFPLSSESRTEEIFLLLFFFSQYPLQKQVSDFPQGQEQEY